MDVCEFFFLDVIGIMPDGIECYIQAPSLDDPIILSLMEDAKSPYDKKIKLVGEVKKQFTGRLASQPIQGYFNRVELKLNNVLLFEGYDGAEYGTFSKDVKLPEWFSTKYGNLECYFISTDW